MAIPRPRGDRPAPVRAGAERRMADTGYFASRCKAAPRRRKIVGDRRCGQAIEGLPDPWPDPAHREAAAAASGQVEGKTMATLGSFAKVPRWHWQSVGDRAVKAKTRIAATSARADNGRCCSARASPRSAPPGRRPPRTGAANISRSSSTIPASLSRSTRAGRAARIEGGTAFNLIWSRRSGN